MSEPASEPALRIPPPDFLADKALSAVLDALPAARLVGGCVRDTLAGRPVADIDLAIPDPPEQVIAALREAGLKFAPTGIAHGTVTAIATHRGFEVTTLRRDVETDGRHAVVSWTDDWRQDAARRDFTINAMSMTRAGEVFDYFGGIADLHAGLVRFVGDAATRIAEDRLRALRFFRFHARFGAHFGHAAPDPEAIAAIRAAAPELPALSAERVWSELKRILLADDPCEAVDLMAATGVLAALLPGGADPGRLARLVARDGPADPLLRLAALAPSDAEMLAGRFKLSTAARGRLAALRAAPLANPSLDESGLRRLLADWPGEALLDRAWLDGGTGPAWDRLRRALATTPRPVFPLEGRDALALGMPPGPDVGEALRAVRAWWLEGGCTADAAACRARLAKLTRG
jgi:poly(A) polymerase